MRSPPGHGWRIDQLSTIVWNVLLGDPHRTEQLFYGIEAVLRRSDIDTALQERYIVLPTLSTIGARILLKRLCEDANFDINGDYLKPRGARRGLRHELCKRHAGLTSISAMARASRRSHESYSDIS